MKRRLAAGLLCALLCFHLAGTQRLCAAQDDPRLEGLFAELRSTERSADGERIGREIAAIWLESGKADIDQLMAEGRRFLAEDNLHFAVDRFRRVTVLAPDFAEGWNKLGHATYLVGDYRAALRCARRAVALEPRHFLAHAGLGMLHLRLGDEARALDALERALTFNPHLARTRRLAAHLRHRLEGKDI